MNQSAPRTHMLNSLLKVESGEWRRLLLAFVTFFVLLGTWFMLRPIRNTTAANNADILHWLYLATFSIMLIAVPFFGFLVSRYRRKTFLPVVYSFFILNLCLFALLFKGDATSIWVQRSFYVWASVFNLFVVSLFWSFMADIFRSEQAQRLFGTIMAGGSLGAILGPIAAAAITEHYGAGAAMKTAIATLTLALVLLMTLGRNAGQTDFKAEQEKLGGGILEGALRVFRSEYLIYICLLMFAHNLISTFLYNGMAILVDEQIAGFDQRTIFFSRLDWIVNLIAFSLQFFLTSRLLAKFGMRSVLVAVPLILAAGLTLIGSTLTLVVFAAVQVAQRSMNYGMLGPGKEMLFTVVDRETKYKCKNFIDTAVYRGSDVTASWAFKGLLSLGLGISQIAWVLAPFTLLWGLIAWRLARLYHQLRAQQVSVESHSVSPD